MRWDKFANTSRLVYRGVSFWFDVAVLVLLVYASVALNYTNGVLYAGLSESSSWLDS